METPPRTDGPSDPTPRPLVTLATGLLTLASVAACAAPEPEPPEAEPFVYRAPDPASVTYLSADTSEVSIRTPMGDMEVRGPSTMTLGLVFTPAEEGVLRVEMTIEDLEMTITNPMFGDLTLDESIVDEPFVFHLGPRGGIEIVEAPEVPAAAGGFFDGSQIAHGLFPALPPEAPSPGDRWTDTLRHSGGEAGMRMTTTTVVTYTLLRVDAGPAGDLLEVRAEGTAESSARGESEGVEIAQEMEGTQEGTLLLDPATAMPVEVEWRRSFSGAMEIPDVGMSGMEMTMSARSHVRRVDVPPEEGGGR